MATVFLSTAPVQRPLPLPAMSTTRRVPLSNNPNAANSPMRAVTAAAHGAKKSRSHAELLREEAYGQPPPAKRQMVERGVASPTRSKTTRTIVHRTASRAAVGATQKGSQAAAAYTPTEKEIEHWQQWHAGTRAAFPKMVFYFESVTDENRAKIAKHIAHLGAVSTRLDIAVWQESESLPEPRHSARRSSSQLISPMSSPPGRSLP